MTATTRAHKVKARARDLGFDAVGITDLAPTPHNETLQRWLEEGMAGSMTYMGRQATRRLEPSRILAGATRAVVVLKNHYRPDPPPATHPVRGRVAKYARGEDYHTALGEPLERLATFIRSLGHSGAITRWYVDAGPVPERELAQRAGLGWIGKNTMLIDPRRGSFTFIATVLTDVDLDVDLPFEADRCGSCTRCLDACPTGAFVEQRLLDARRCISYLTIEHKGPIEPSLAAMVGDWIFGCDVCQDVCPWNEKFAEAAEAPELNLTPRLASVDLATASSMSETQFAAMFGRTALERTGLDGLSRNATIVLNNLSTAHRDG